VRNAVDNLRDFIPNLAVSTQRIKHPRLDPLKIAEIADRVVKTAGPALLSRTSRSAVGPVAIAVWFPSAHGAALRTSRRHRRAHRKTYQDRPPEGLLGKWRRA